MENTMDKIGELLKEKGIEFKVSQLQRLNKENGEALVLCGRMYPYLSHLSDIELYPFADMRPLALPRLPKKIKSEPFDYNRYLSARKSVPFLFNEGRNSPEQQKMSGTDQAADQHDGDTSEKQYNLHAILDKKFQELYGKNSS